MGIKGLTKFIADAAPNAIKEIKIENLMGRVVAIDASMSLYQFIIAIRDSEQYGNLTNESGETTSHISGLMSRSIKLMENGLKPIYVFDGAPPELKGSELEKRGEKRQKAEELLKKAKEEGNLEEIKKQSGRTVRVTKKQNEEAKKLLTLMGIPVVEAPCEAESQCAFLTKYNLAHATATEDADALVFGTKILIRNLNANASSTSQNKNKNSSKRGYILTEINLEQVLKGLNLNMNEFIDFCILCGCDYCDTIKGIGSKTAYNLIKEYNSIEKIIENIDKNKYQIPSNFRFVEARDSFINPKVLSKEEIKIDWGEPKIEELKNFLIKDYNFNEVRVTNYINRLLKARKVTTQRRLDNFFTACTKKSTKLVNEESQIKKEVKPKRKGKKRDAPNDSSTKLNSKQNKKPKGEKESKTEKDDGDTHNGNDNEEEGGEGETADMGAKDPFDTEEDEDNPSVNFFHHKSDSESGNVKKESTEQEANATPTGDVYSFPNGKDASGSNIHLSSNSTLHSCNNLNGDKAINESMHVVGSSAPEAGNNEIGNGDLFTSNAADCVNNNTDKTQAEIEMKKKNISFLLPYCPKNVTSVKKRKSVQRC
ncbi:flap endonuclease 1, putative [Plasmodium knowlesi strain H]|uniref:Flap endonuclease 1 n=4 Tax=Plasmodium knowlesi TaxID=5850 RepID=FEN1_PLAKH|nr:flap endonuclease 1, putative [Plasmodium knowlesi strain H]B3L014.1 RecName: Full=Flap endonuclease 1; Short=FEN-1; AltName: Full=Flap structure-specific endonuclease 1 [Plasmodium knowlesi strain H]OTN68612.1 Flap endonuclease 1 [Plasmodium knowlesi]CAA9986493.1 flap endonuclease 1, putative [Plasmodium knowlesi strain H]SBO24250.1 flap endonuclease 1, putative [Plasmodium knowlesi strain H]SBO29740.1 flap endonuclease 1, putative [Plasmodium knowlesi strain H]VVS75967.1 flap endonucleas|eukprot:XP_002261044.1 flap exonuclease, putative [Plasmodium knowlesi strain H]